MADRPPVHAVANDGALRDLGDWLRILHLELAAARGNLDLKDLHLREHAALIKKIRELVETVDFDFVDDALRRRKDERATGQRTALADLRAAFADTADK